ncbi:MAG: exosortase family protein XrtF [Fulvivirga sp.]|uniref:exosortase family protein XrtF n=1 Tax=Fulvivirga sp. TaxID=1931237 RepID=UPI0032EEEB09
MILLNKINDPKMRKAIGFVLSFLTLYLMLNLVYYAYHKFIFPDTIFFTDIAAYQTEYLLQLFGHKTSLTFDENYPKIYLNRDNVVILAIYEGCNAATLYIILVSFLLSYFQLTKNILLVIISGIVIMNILNVARITGLYYVSQYNPREFYFYHKYLFNGALLGAVILIWLFALKKYNDLRR